MLEMTHRTFYLFLGRVYSPSQQVLHKVFDIRRGELLLAREIALPRLTDGTLKTYRDTAPDAVRNIEDTELVNIVKNKSSVFLIFHLGCTDVDRLFGVRIRAEKPVPEQLVYDMIAEVTNIMCFEESAVSLLMQETINLNTIPSTISTISACTCITDEGKILFAVGLLALCLMTVTPFADTSKRIHHLILDLTEYEFTLESSLYSDALVDIVTRMCVIAGPCAPLDSLPITFNEIVTVPTVSRFIRDIDDYCKVEPEAGQAAPSSSEKTSTQLLPYNICENLKHDDIVDNIVEIGIGYELPMGSDCGDTSDTVALPLRQGPESINEHPTNNIPPSPTVYRDELNTGDYQGISSMTINEDAPHERNTRNMRAVRMYTDTNHNCKYDRDETESCSTHSVVTPFKSTSTHTRTYSTAADVHVGNRVVDIVTTAYLAAEPSGGKGRCKSVSFENNRQNNRNADASDITLIARKEYIKYY